VNGLDIRYLLYHDRMTAHAALLIIDMQVEHMAEAAGADQTVATVAELRTRATATDAPVFLIQHEGAELRRGSPAWEIVPELSPGPADIVLPKKSADSFVDTDLQSLLREMAVTTVVITGYCTEYCVDSTTRSALGRGFDVVLVADGHTTTAQDPDDPGLSPEQIVRHHNKVFTTISYPGRSVQVRAAREVTFGQSHGRTAPAGQPA
jgi:nicotinamidase-related amidase